jgi:hypothetical protein
VFHVVSKGIEATIDWLAAIERFLRDPAKGLDYGAVSHLVYHLYNWQQFAALLPIGREGLKERLQDVRQFIDEDDKGAALAVLKGLMQSVEECGSASGGVIARRRDVASPLGGRSWRRGAGAGWSGEGMIKGLWGVLSLVEMCRGITAMECGCVWRRERYGGTRR